jgi:hypothetical protein
MNEWRFWLCFWAMVGTVIVTIALTISMYWTGVNTNLVKLIEAGACPVEAKYALDPGMDSERWFINSHKCGE